jgi:hypothetical protein
LILTGLFLRLKYFSILLAALCSLSADPSPARNKPTMLQLIANVFLGVLGTLFFLFVRGEQARRRKGIITRTIYMNVIVHNKRQVLKEKVRSALPDPLKLGETSWAKRKMAGLVNHLVSDQAFTEKLAAGVVAGAPANLTKVKSRPSRTVRVIPTKLLAPIGRFVLHRNARTQAVSGKSNLVQKLNGQWVPKIYLQIPPRKQDSVRAAFAM